MRREMDRRRRNQEPAGIRLLFSTAGGLWQITILVLYF